MLFVSHCFRVRKRLPGIFFSERADGKFLAVGERRDGSVAIGSQKPHPRLGVAFDDILRRLSKRVCFAYRNNGYAWRYRG